MLKGSLDILQAERHLPFVDFFTGSAGRARSGIRVPWLLHFFLYLVYNTILHISSLLIIIFIIVLSFVVMVVCVKVEVRHQIGLYIVHRLGQGLQELIEIFLVEKDLVPVITVLIKFLPAFRDRKIVIVTTSSPYIEEICPEFPRPDAFAVNAFHSFVVVVVRHNELFCENYKLSSHKYSIVFE